MSGPFQIDGAWPGATILRRGWGKAVARPWNKVSGEGAVRLIRGNTAFLADATEWTARHANGVVLSPALYKSATRIWKRVGYGPGLELRIMERSLDGASAEAARGSLPVVTTTEKPGLRSIVELDERAFDDFWHMDEAGIQEALGATTRNQVFEARSGDELVGYAVVGAQLGISFLQRIAVDPAFQGRGFGNALVEACLRWGAASGASTMLLNVRDENERARSLYRSHGFRDTKNQLEVLRYEA